MGFTRVFEYTAGKQDWLAAGLPTEGRAAGELRVGRIARPDVATCRLDERLGDVAERTARAGWEECVVVNDARIVLGLLRATHLEGAPDRTVEEAMAQGPSTFRPHVSVSEMARFMQDHDLPSAPITTGDGELIGLLLREDAIRMTEEANAEGHHGDAG